LKRARHDIAHATRWFGSWALALGLLVTSAPGAVAQSAESPLLRGGQVRFEFLPEVRLWNERYGGTTDPFDQVEPLGFDFTRAQVDTAFLPSLGPIQEELRTLLQDSAFSASLGATDVRMTANRTEIPLGLGIGVFDWLTVGVRVPFVRRRVEVDFDLDPATATLGQSPGLQDASVQTYLGELDAVIAQVTGDVDARCTALGANDPTCLSGQAALAEALSLQTLLGDAFMGVLFPTSGSAAATRLLARVTGVSQALQQQGDSAFVVDTWATPLPFASDVLGAAEFQALVTDPALGVDGEPISSVLTLWELGDVEFSAALRLVERSRSPAIPAGDSLADSIPARSVGFLLGVGATYRLGTGTPDRAENFLDIGSGDGQDDIEIQVFGRLDLGARLRTRFDLRYGRQQEGSITKRLGDPAHVIRPAINQRELLWNPGDYREIMIAPELRVAPEFSLGLRYRYYSKGADTFSFASPVDPALNLPSIDLMSRETELQTQHVGVGATLWPSLTSTERGQWPLAVSAEYQFPISGKGGLVPKDSRFRVSARLFIDLW